ncbi:fungal-specific transcription factor domain-containing protein, partial [Lineolata rhizophorae]
PSARSCVTCRRRKVKCDKRQPCSNCTRARIECVFPSPGRAPRKPRKPPEAELMERLRRLEGVVQSLGVHVEDEGQGSAGGGATQNGGGGGGQMVPQAGRSDSTGGGEQREAMIRDIRREDKPFQDLEARFGRLVIEEGRSRYINNSFWASLNNEVEDLKGILEHSDEEDDDYSSPGAGSASNSTNHQEFVFGYSSNSVDLTSLHPSPEKICQYWQLFKENVDPVVKVLHIPTIEPIILDAKDHLDRIPKGLEALMFAIYYCAITSVTWDNCMDVGEDKLTMLKRYRFAVEQALARANFLTTDEMIVLQAFVMFLICLRRNDNAKVIWTLTGLVVRMAQTLGVHRDGSQFHLRPFETEMRRRLWCQICILDTRASEDHGCDPTIVESLYDTKMALNVNDSDLDPSMEDFPESRVGCTEMTFCLIRFEIGTIFRRIQFVPPGPPRCHEYFAAATLKEKEQWITECHQQLEERYLQHCDMSVPLYWVTATVCRLIMSKMWLMAYHPYQRMDGGSSLPQEIRDRLFVTSLENVEYALLLEQEERVKRWGWLFRTYVQWHAIAFLLSELCVRTTGDTVARAWRAVEDTARRRLGDPDSNNRNGQLWKPLRKLIEKARGARQ